MDKNVLVSVLMPVFNCEKFLSESIMSILSQTFTNFEFLILDDGSTDKSLAIIEKFREQDKRIKVFKNEKNMGVVESRNRLINLSTGKYIVWIDSDDIALPKRISEQVKFLNKNPDVGLVGANLIRIDEKGNKKCVWKYETNSNKLKVELFFHSPFSTVVMIRRSALPEKLYDEMFSVAEDYDFYCRIAENCRIANIPIPLLKCRDNSKSLSNLKKSEMKILTVEVIKKHSERLGIILNKKTIKILRLILESKKIDLVDIEKTEKALILFRNSLFDSQLFDADAVKMVVQHYWFESCRKSSYNGMVILKIFFKSELYYKLLTLKNNMRLFMRCVFKV